MTTRERIYATPARPWEEPPYTREHCEVCGNYQDQPNSFHVPGCRNGNSAA